MRNFANCWSQERSKYIEEIGELEHEFKSKLLDNYQLGIFTPICRKV